MTNAEKSKWQIARGGLMTEYPFVFCRKNNARHKELKGRRLRILARRAKGSIKVEFMDGSQETISRRSIRRVNPIKE